MPDAKTPDGVRRPSDAHAGSRPRSRMFLSLDLKNAYARLGMSPLASDKDIADKIGKLRSAAVKRLKAKGNATIDDPDQQETFRLDKIEEEIGNGQKRNAYDERFPQNILLTVQPSPTEQAWARHRRAGLISLWVQGALADDALCPTPANLRLWSPGGVEAELLDFLSGYSEHDPAAASSRDTLPKAAEVAAPVSFDGLNDLLE